jgi:hypothetical protein
LLLLASRLSLCALLFKRRAALLLGCLCSCTLLLSSSLGFCSLLLSCLLRVGPLLLLRRLLPLSFSLGCRLLLLASLLRAGSLLLLRRTLPFTVGLGCRLLLPAGFLHARALLLLSYALLLSCCLSTRTLLLLSSLALGIDRMLLFGSLRAVSARTIRTGGKLRAPLAWSDDRILARFTSLRLYCAPFRLLSTPRFLPRLLLRFTSLGSGRALRFSGFTCLILPPFRGACMSCNE